MPPFLSLLLVYILLFSRNSQGPAVVDGFVQSCMVATPLHRSSSIATEASGLAALSGQWELDKESSEPLTPFLKACGVPIVVAPFLSKAFDGDDLEIVNEAGTQSVAIALKRNGWSLPFKLQTDASYTVGEETSISTPRGPQQGSIMAQDDSSFSIKRAGPGPMEHVEEHYALTETGLQMTLKHVDEKETITVQRNFRRKDAEENIAE